MTRLHDLTGALDGLASAAAHRRPDGTSKGGRVQRYLREDPQLAALYDKFHRHAAPLISSNYDITRECNLRCEGCLFFEGEDYISHPDDKSLGDYDLFFQRERARGVNYPYFAGGEPALEQDRLRLASRHFQRGSVVTNGTIALDPDIRFSVHVSIWGDEETTKLLRGGSVLRKSLMNYVGDRRATFIYTVNHMNIDAVPAVVAACRDHGVRLSFSHYSPTERYHARIAAGAPNDGSYFRISNATNNLCLTDDDLAHAHEVLARMIEDYPETVVYSRVYNDWISRPGSLYDIDPATGIARDCPTRLSDNHRHYYVDLVQSTAKCCAPNIDCRSCRAYAMSHAAFRHRIRRHLDTRESFVQWMEIVDSWCRLYLLDWDKIPLTLETERLEAGAAG